MPCLLHLYVHLGENSVKSHSCQLRRWTDLLECQFCLPSYQIFANLLKHFLEFLLVVQLVLCSVLMEHTKIFKLYPVQEGKIRTLYSGCKESGPYLCFLPMCIYLLIPKVCKLARPSLSEGLSSLTCTP